MGRLVRPRHHPSKLSNKKMHNKRRMTAHDFEAVRPLVRISDSRLEAARCALVDDEPLDVIGERYGWRKQSVSDCVTTVWKTLEAFQEGQRAQQAALEKLPPGWERLTLVAPTYLIEKWKAELAEVSKKPSPVEWPKGEEKKPEQSDSTPNWAKPPWRHF